MRVRTLGYPLLIAAHLAAPEAAAQRVAQRPLALAANVDGAQPLQQAPRSVQRDVDDGNMILGGVLIGAAGFVIGGFAGASALCGSDSGDDFCGLVGFFWGAAAGESLLLPVGVHLGNRRRGNLPLAMLASAGIAAAGLGVAFAMNDATPLLIVPVAQLLTVIVIERGTSRDAR